MSIRLGNNIVAGRSSYQPSLFDIKWADHLLHDVQWLRADTFSWQYAGVYTPAYQHLLDDIDGKEAQSETIEGIQITYYLASDGHKICMPDQEDYIKKLYDKVGVAWYYILDTTNQCFKLPRTKFGFGGLKDYNNVGDLVKAGLPNITGYFGADVPASNDLYRGGAFTSALIASSTENSRYGNSRFGNVYGYSFNAAVSNPIYGRSDTVQMPTTQMYLYFYVGNFTQTALENTAGVNLEAVQSIMDATISTVDEKVDEVDEALADLDTMINAQYHPNIFDQKWTDSIINDIQWLRSNTNSWQSGDVYETAYNHLVNDVQNSSIQKRSYVNHNITLVGNTRVNENGILAGFNDSSVGVLNGVYIPSTSFECVVKVHTPSSYSNSTVLHPAPNCGNEGFVVRATSATNIKLWISSNGSSWDIVSEKNCTCNFPSNKDIWVKFTWDGTTYTLSLSNDGIIYIDIGTVSSTLPVYFNSGTLGLGGYTGGSGYSFTDGTIDLKESYIKIDGQFVWKGANFITYTEAADGHKIVSANQAEYVNYIYNKTGMAWYYVLDTTNTRFKLPRKRSTQVVKSYKGDDNTWYKLYADGWVEQGGLCQPASNNNTTIQLSIPFSDTSYNINAIAINDNSYAHADKFVAVRAFTTSTITFAERYISGNSSLPVKWKATGMSSIDMSEFQTNEKYLYFYVGKFLQSAIVNTAALNAELFNSKADIDAVVAKGHEVIAFQAPTAGNNYTWYRKYADGWVEQGGYIPHYSSDQKITVTLPVIMANTNYYISRDSVNPNTSGTTDPYWHGAYSLAVGSFDCYVSGTAGVYYNWEVKGMYA